MFEEFDAENAVVSCRVEFIIDYISGDNSKIFEGFRGRDGVDVFFLGSRVGEACYFRVWEAGGEIKG